MTRHALLAVWLLAGVVPFAWWLWSRGHVDVWRSLPVPAALLGSDGKVRRQTGPASEGSLDVDAALPAKGRVATTRATDGTRVAVTGVRGGALAVALPADPVAERRDRILGELGARLAHDINTPLSVLFGHLDLIAHEPISETARASVRTCQKEMTRLQTTASDLLTLTRLRAGGGARRPHLAGALAEEAVAGLIGRADEVGASLTVEVPSERVVVDVADADLVRALRNLVSNALTHGLGERQQVVVAVDADADSVTFSVSDTGPGLSATELERLSEPLVRGDGVTAGGSGLGLAIATEVLAAHGSRLEVAHAQLDGTTLSFTLPRVS